MTSRGVGPESSVAGAYSANAEQYIDLLGTPARVHADDLDLIGRHLGHAAGPVLDVGCGPGHLTGFLRGLGVDVIGIDPVPEFITHARRAHPEAQFELGSVFALDREPASIAGVLAWFSLIHLESDQVDRALDAVRRVLQPEGVVVLGFFDGSQWEPFAHKVTRAYRWPIDEAAERLARAGFVEVERLHRPDDGRHRPHGAIAAQVA